MNRKAEAAATQSKVKNPQQAKDVLNEIALRGSSETGITEQEALEYLETVPDAAMNEATAEYLQFKEAGTYNFKATKVYETTLDNKQVKVVELKDKNGKMYISGATVLVNTVERCDQLPAYIRVIASGEKTKSAKGEYYELRVLIL